ncbi:hypothetical protein C8R44DRAFT_726159 [Mycena epipterygia]|nr:hypothetical protein C8R44DRAFT_726159 [Mycena epipterygia]
MQMARSMTQPGSWMAEGTVLGQGVAGGMGAACGCSATAGRCRGDALRVFTPHPPSTAYIQSASNTAVFFVTCLDVPPSVSPRTSLPGFRLATGNLQFVLGNSTAALIFTCECGEP